MFILALLRKVPLDVWIALAVTAAVSAGLFYTYEKGAAHGAAVVQLKWDAERVAMQEALNKEKERQAQVVTRTVIEYRDRVQIVKVKGDEIVKQIPVLVPGGTCLLNGGFRVLHDAAASGELPQDPRGAAAAADPVEVPAALETVAENYTACRADQARLSALQELVKGINPEGVTP